jgi:hypothetical protein
MVVTNGFSQNCLGVFTYVAWTYILGFFFCEKVLLICALETNPYFIDCLSLELELICAKGNNNGTN